MATQTQYPIRNIRGADELYGKKICKFKWKGGSFYAPMIQTTQFQRTAVVIEHSTVTDMPIAQYGLCKSPTVTLTLYLTDAVPYKTSQLTYNVNDVTPKRIVDDLNTIYEKHLPFNITIPQAFTDYLHDLVITSLVFQTSADKRFVVQADITATSVNVIKLGYQQGVVVTESTEKKSSDTMYIAELTDIDSNFNEIKNNAANLDNAGLLKFVPEKYRLELYNSLDIGGTENLLLAVSSPLKYFNNFIKGQSEKNTIQDKLGLSNVQTQLYDISQGKVGFASTYGSNVGNKINVSNIALRDRDIHENTKSVTYNLVAAAKTKDGQEVITDVEVTEKLDLTDCNVCTLPPADYIEKNILKAKVSALGTGISVFPGMEAIGAAVSYHGPDAVDLLYPSEIDQEEYAKLLAANTGNDLIENESAWELYQRVNKMKDETNENRQNINEIRNDPNSKFYTSNKYSGDGLGTDQEIVSWLYSNGKIPINDNGDILIQDYRNGKISAEVKDKDGNTICSNEMHLLTNESTISDCGTFSITMTSKTNAERQEYELYDVKTQLCNNKGKIEFNMYSPEFNTLLDISSDVMSDE